MFHLQTRQGILSQSISQDIPLTSCAESDSKDTASMALRLQVRTASRSAKASAIKGEATNS
ncbi:hypothetical protein DY000_02052087 [Brassica cretica]|uniref:Uncharacterized protein n=1 Tax=Brassica cretica TaxID=69181 RepID=A0ABQ7A8C8_BRACR|nr:hypothetical protein DY000_02052087 [Brassica cretica]